MLADAGTVLFMPKSTEALVFGRRLKELRKRRGLSQKAVSYTHLTLPTSDLV